MRNVFGLPAITPARNLPDRFDGTDLDRAARQLCLHHGGDGVRADVGQRQRLAHPAAERVGIAPHPARALRAQGQEVGRGPPLRVEKLVDPVGPQPLLHELQVRRVLLHVGHRHLVRPERSLHGLAVQRLDPRPSLERPQNNHRPARLVDGRAGPGGPLNLANLGQRLVHRPGHRGVEVVALHQVRIPAVAPVERGHFLVAHRAGDRRIADLVTVDVQHGQDRAALRRIEELRAVPCRRRRPGFGLAVADDATDDQVGIVERRAERRRQGVTQFAALVDRAGNARVEMAGKPARPGETPHELVQAGVVQGQFRVEGVQAAFEIEVGEVGGRAVPRAGDEENVQILAPDEAVEVRVDEIDARARPPVPEQTILDVLGPQRFAQEHVVAQVDLRSGQVVGGPAVAGERREAGIRNRGRVHRLRKVVRRNAIFLQVRPGTKPRPCDVSVADRPASRRRAQRPERAKHERTNISVWPWRVAGYEEGSGLFSPPTTHNPQRLHRRTSLALLNGTTAGHDRPAASRKPPPSCRDRR